MTEARYAPRIIDGWLRELFGELPALLITGPRAAGKTTTAERLAATVVRLDREPEAEPFRADPDAALRSFQEPLLLDEWQAVPEVLGAVKRAVDDGQGAGRFLVTGSVRGSTARQLSPTSACSPTCSCSIRSPPGARTGSPASSRRASAT